MRPNKYTYEEININHAKIISYNVIALNHIKEEISYVFDRNVSLIADNSGANLYIAYTFF